MTSSLTINETLKMAINETLKMALFAAHLNAGHSGGDSVAIGI